MHDILIVDDDPIIREGLRRMVKGFEGCTAVHTAGNGNEALEKVCTVCIGMIFLDIKMPILDGIGLMKKLSELEFRGEVVIISGFDDYEFVRSAMKLGASDYILKPVCENDLRAVLNECRARISGKACRFGAQQFGKKDLLTEIYAQQALVERLLTIPGSAEEYVKYEEIPENCTVLAAVLDSFGKGSISDMDKQAAFLMGISMLDSLMISPPAHLVQGEYSQLFTMLFFLPGDAAEQAAKRLSSSLLAQGLRFGVSSSACPLGRIADAYAKALACLEQYFFDLTEEPPESPESFPFSSSTAYAVEKIAVRDIKGVHQAVLELFRQVCAYRPGVENVRQLFVSIIYTLMNKNKDFIGIIGKFKFTDKDIVHAVREAPTISYLKKCFLSLIHVYIDALNEKLLSREDYAIQKAKYYIANGYHNNLSLGDISERLGLHPNYLSSLFKHKTGETFSDYLRKVRMEKAVQLMTETNLKMYEIACQVGYNDNAQFYRAFKQAMGVSPGEYKRHHLES